MASLTTSFRGRERLRTVSGWLAKRIAVVLAQHKTASRGAAVESTDPFATGKFPLCPATHDVGIRRLFDLGTLLLMLDCRPGDVVLDLGAGPGFSSEMLARLGYGVIALDPDVSSLRHNRRRVTFDARRIEGSVAVTGGIAERLPFASATFDGVLGMNVLHHVGAMKDVLDELARVLKPGCRGVFVEPGLEHLTSTEAQRAIIEHGEDDQAFDVFAFLRASRERGFSQAMLSATLQSALRLLPIEEVDLYISGAHPRPHMTPQGVIDELRQRHAYAMIVREGARAKTSRYPGVLRRDLHVSGVPQACARGAAFTVHADVTNTGDTLWYHTPSSMGGFVTLACKLKTPTGRLVDEGLGRTLLMKDMPPGEAARVSVMVALPPTVLSGEYDLEFDLVNELVCWFADVGNAPGPSFRIAVT